MTGLSPVLLARVEAAGIRAGETIHQRDVDGWLVRTAPSRAKRSRCINALAAGHQGVDAKIAACTAIYRAASLPTVFRVTPFSLPTSLDTELNARGWRLFDETLVMVAPSLESFALQEPANTQFEWPELRAMTLSQADFVAWTAATQGWSADDARELSARLERAPVRHESLALVDPNGEMFAGGQMAVDGDVVGLYSIFTTPPARRRGLARRLCHELIERAIRQRATAGYLQVEATNAAARRLYTAIGFVDAYRYHYRAEPDAPQS